MTSSSCKGCRDGGECDAPLSRLYGFSDASVVLSLVLQKCRPRMLVQTALISESMGNTVESVDKLSSLLTTGASLKLLTASLEFFFLA